MRTTRFRPWPAAALVVVLSTAAVPLIAIFSPVLIASGSMAQSDPLDELRQIASGSTPRSVAIVESRQEIAKASTAQPDAIDELRREFASAGPPNFKAIMQEATTLGSSLTITKFVITEQADGLIKSEREERQFYHTLGVDCTLAATESALFAGLLDVPLSGSRRLHCSDPRGSASSHSGYGPLVVTDVEGRLFPLKPGNEVRFHLRREGAVLFGSMTRRLTVIDVLDGATLNVIGGPDRIYLLRDEETDNKMGLHFLADIYWSSALRWPIQLRLRGKGKNPTMSEINLVAVAGVAPYSLPDGRFSHGLERTRIAVSADEMDAIGQKLKPAMLAEKDEAGRESTRRLVGALVAPAAASSSELPPAFATIAPFVTLPREASR